MRYLRAEKGIRKISFAQVFAIAAAFLSGGTSLLLNVVVRELFNEEILKTTPLLLTSLLCSLLSIVALVLTSVFALIGYFQAAKDEDEFRKALICTISGGALTIIGTFFQIPNGAVYTIFTAAGTIVGMFVMIFAVTGIINLAEKCSRPDILGSGNKLLNILVITYIVSAVNTLVIRIFELSPQARAVAVIVSAVDLAASLTRYFLFLKYLKRSYVMLSEHNSTIDGE